jgi:hypothetical protein
MNKLTSSILLFFIGYSSLALATDVKCDSYHGKPSNILKGLTVFNARYADDKEEEELAPTSEKQRGNVLTQFWDLTAYREPKIFVTCDYKDKTSITLEIDKTVDICERIVAANKKIAMPVPPGFHCYKKSTFRKVMGKTCGLVGH